MTDNHLILYRLAELMLQNEQHVLPVDLLFEDEQIGDFVKSIQIDSPYQQMLLEGVLTESVKGEKLYVSYTVEGYFHYVLGEVIHKQTDGKQPKQIKNIIEKNKLNGVRQGVEYCLIRDIESGIIDRLIVLIDLLDKDLELFSNPLIYAFEKVEFIKESKGQGKALFDNHLKKVIEKLFSKPTTNDFKCLSICILKCSRLYKINLIKALANQLLKIKEFDNYYAIEMLADITSYLDDINDKLGTIKVIKSWLQNNHISWKNEIQIYSRIGDFYREVPMINEARECTLKCLEHEIREYGENHEFTSNSYQSLGYLELLSGNFTKAKELYIKSLKIREIVLDKENKKITDSLHCIALCLLHKSEYEQTIELYEKVMERRLKYEGLFSISSAQSISNLGIAYLDSEIDEIKGYDLVYKSYEINNKLLGINNIRNTFLIPYIARHKYFIHGEFLEAEKLLLENLGIKKIIHGSESLSVAYSYNHLSEFYKEQEDFDNALKYALHAHDIYEKSIFNPDFYLDNLKEIADYYFNLDFFEQSKSYFKKALEFCKSKFDLSDLRVAELNKGLGNVYESQNDFILAIDSYQNAISIEIEKLGEESEDVAISRIDIGDVFIKLKEYKKAIDYFEIAFTYFKTGGIPMRIGFCYEQLLQLDKALIYYIEAAILRKKQLGLNDENTKVSINRSKELALELNKENLLPNWIRKYII
jgi:tetratricopeptide (TPR) repeat protein